MPASASHENARVDTACRTPNRAAPGPGSSAPAAAAGERPGPRRHQAQQLFTSPTSAREKSIPRMRNAVVSVPARASETCRGRGGGAASAAGREGRSVSGFRTASGRVFGGGDGSSGSGATTAVASPPPSARPCRGRCHASRSGRRGGAPARRRRAWRYGSRTRCDRRGQAAFFRRRTSVRYAFMTMSCEAETNATATARHRDGGEVGAGRERGERGDGER